MKRKWKHHRRLREVVAYFLMTALGDKPSKSLDRYLKDPDHIRHRIRAEATGAHWERVRKAFEVLSALNVDQSEHDVPSVELTSVGKGEVAITGVWGNLPMWILEEVERCVSDESHVCEFSELKDLEIVRNKPGVYIVGCHVDSDPLDGTGVGLEVVSRKAL